MLFSKILKEFIKRKKLLLIIFLILINFSIFFIKLSGCYNDKPRGKSLSYIVKIKKISDKTDSTKIVEQLTEKLDSSFSIISRFPFVIAGNYSAQYLDRIAERNIFKVSKILKRDYFTRGPTSDIIILLFRGQESYRKWARILLNDMNPPYFGYFRHDINTLIMDFETGSGTLLHELTHALVRYDFPDIPLWFNEALATLHEGCYVEDAGIRGAINWRLKILKSAIRKNSTRNLSDIINSSDFYEEKYVDINYAEIRYFAMYMQLKRKLKLFYRKFRDAWGETKHPDAVKIIEEIFGKSILSIQTDFISWVKSLK
ncbi:MAG: hypothetical protein JXR95_00060 [Deltaproteobacteria bacterium]|nr:hypothetical protein [Deltaproteobacteria bacterium]